MAHTDKILDTDKHFEIDPITRAIKNQSPSKVSVMQYDHNSERFTFTLPKSIEGHDMTECNRIEVHYINTDSATKESNAGVYEVSDLGVSPEDENILTCSWLVSQNATQKVGALSFLLRFACVDAEGNIEYAWNTGIFKGIHVSNGMYNSEIIVEQYADVLEQWKNELNTGGGGGNVDLSDYVEKKEGYGLASIIRKVDITPTKKEHKILSIDMGDEWGIQEAQIPAYVSDLVDDIGLATTAEITEKVKKYTGGFVDIYLSHNTIYLCEELEAFNLICDVDMTSENEPFECSLLLKVGEFATSVMYSAYPITWAGDDCDSDGHFAPTANKTYEISIKKFGDIVSARVGVI